MSPEMAEVIYSISFTLWEREDKARRSKKILESMHPVYILPRRQEHAPILVPSNNKHYHLRSETNLSRGVLRHPLGKLIASATQPLAILLQSLGTKNIRLSTTIKMNRRFEPARQDQAAPCLVGAEFQLRAMTFFGLDPWQYSPDLSDVSTWGSRRGMWSEYVSLTVGNEVRVDWKCQRERDQLFFTASIETSVSLPHSRRYPSTSHSCLVSRVYSLKTKMFYRGHEQARSSSSIVLFVPVELCAN
jgi:hypothetical protein